jgi:hypothetical protein
MGAHEYSIMCAKHYISPKLVNRGTQRNTCGSMHKRELKFMVCIKRLKKPTDRTAEQITVRRFLRAHQNSLLNYVLSALDARRTYFIHTCSLPLCILFYVCFRLNMPEISIEFLRTQQLSFEVRAHRLFNHQS